jgi:hypothetical protein
MVPPLFAGTWIWRQLGRWKNVLPNPGALRVLDICALGQMANRRSRGHGQGRPGIGVKSSLSSKAVTSDKNGIRVNHESHELTRTREDRAIGVNRPYLALVFISVHSWLDLFSAATADTG